MKSLRSILPILLLTISSGVALAQGELVLNNGFEINTAPGGRGGPLHYAPNGGDVPSAFANWFTAGLDTSIGDGSYTIAPRSGLFSAAFGQVGGTGSLYQDITTVPGTDYSFSFQLALDTGETAGTTTMLFSAQWDGLTVLSRDDSSAVGIFSYTPYSFTVKATSTTTRIVFTGQNDPGFYFLDDISVTPVTAVPEPGTWAAAALAVGLIGSRLRRRGGR